MQARDLNKIKHHLGTRIQYYQCVTMLKPNITVFTVSAISDVPLIVHSQQKMAFVPGRLTDSWLTNDSVVDTSDCF